MDDSSTSIVPTRAKVARWTARILSALILLFWGWQPLPASIFSAQNEGLRLLLTGVFLLGLATVLYSTFLIDHFDLFGRRQVLLHLSGERYADKGFVTPSLYRFIRHPLYLGWLIAFWVTPHMTQGHLFFSILSSAYIFVAIPFEERDLLQILGDDYRRYREHTSMIFPLPGLWRRASSRSD